MAPNTYFMFSTKAIADKKPSTDNSSQSVFRLHLNSEPANFNPLKQKTSASNYLLHNLHRSLMRVDINGKLQPELAKECRIQKNKILCTLRENLKWSDGSSITNEDFKRSLLKVLDLEFQSPRADLLFPIQNAEAIYTKKISANQLGIKLINKNQIVFNVAEAPEEFLWVLASYITIPIHKNASDDLQSGPFSGPYKLEKSSAIKNKISIHPNAYFFRGHTPRPSVEYFIITEDSTALNLYIRNNLDFLRRLPTLWIPEWKNKKDFQWIPLIRFDYMGFGPSLKNETTLRQSLTSSLDYLDLSKIFYAEGRPPGCSGLPDEWFTNNNPPCFKFQKVENVLSTKKKLSLRYSTLGGEDHRRAAEWFQSQWKKNLNLDIETASIENKIFNSTIENSPPDIFRKGLTADRTTCLGVLETFTSKHPENYIQFKNNDYDSLIDQLKKKPKDKALCTKTLELLMKSHVLIPLGQMHFAILARPKFKGWELNPLNQLDLSNLSTIPDAP